MNPEISIIIPTYNRLETLKKCLEAIIGNNFNHPFEAIIIDDDSTDNTFVEISSFIENRKLNSFHIFKQEKSGPAKARNLGIRKAKAEILLIIGDDSLAHKNLLREHYVWNKEKYPEENIAILGLSQWDSQIKITPFMRWIDQAELQFSYLKLKNEHSSNWGNLWTCNISLKKSFLEKYGMFCEDFPYAAWEDIELGWRLSKHGFDIKYNKDAIVFHHHPTTFASVKKRMVVHGFSQMILAEKMGSEYSNKFFQQPLKFLVNVFDFLITYSGVLFLLDKAAVMLEKIKIIPFAFYPVLYHYKLKGNKKYVKAKNSHR